MKKKSRESRTSIVPFLVQRAVPRGETQSLPGAYCSERRVWLIDSQDGLIPLVRAPGQLPELETKTFSGREEDDQSILPLALVTKTSAQLERDDADLTLSSDHLLLELTTKTKSNRERDD